MFKAVFCFQLFICLRLLLFLMSQYKARSQNSSHRGLTTDFLYLLVQVCIFEKGIMKTTSCAPFFSPVLPFGRRIPAGTLGKETFNLHINTQHLCLCVRLMWCNLCLLKMFLTSKCHLIMYALSQSMFSQTFYTINTQGENG